jgi:hypothetical protein
MKQICQILWCPLFRVHRDISNGHNCENYACWLIRHRRCIKMYGWRTRLIFCYYPVTVSEQILPHMNIRISLPINCSVAVHLLAKEYNIIKSNASSAVSTSIFENLRHSFVNGK